MAQNSGAPRSQEDYITQVSEDIEGRVTKRLSKEFSRTENRILGALARLDDFLMNPLLPGHSGTTPEPTRNTTRNNQGTNEDGSQNDPHPEAGLFHGQTTRNVSLEERPDTYCFEISLLSAALTSYFSSRKMLFPCPLDLLAFRANALHLFGGVLCLWLFAAFLTLKSFLLAPFFDICHLVIFSFS